jgi:hypothetical protein
MMQHSIKAHSRQRRSTGPIKRTVAGLEKCPVARCNFKLDTPLNLAIIVRLGMELEDKNRALRRGVNVAWEDVLWRKRELEF